MPGGSAPAGLGISISVNSVRVPLCSASLIRVTLPENSRSGSSGTRTIASTPGATPSRILRNIDPHADHILLHDLEHECPRVCIALDQRADIDIALGDDAIEGCHDRGIVAVLMQHR